MREEPADARRVRRTVDMPVERVLEVELARVAQLHDRRRGERLRDRADAVLRVGSRIEARLDVGGADRGFPDELAVAQHGGGKAGQPLLSLRAAHALLELGHEAFRRGQRAPPAFVRRPGRCRCRRYRDASLRATNPDAGRQRRLRARPGVHSSRARRGSGRSSSRQSAGSMPMPSASRFARV